MEFANVKAFAEMSKDLSEAMKAYALNYNLQRKGLKAFADHSEEEQKKLINKAFAIEVAKQSGMELPDLNKRSEPSALCRLRPADRLCLGKYRRDTFGYVHAGH